MLLFFVRTRIDVYETLCPQQMLVHKGGKIKNWVGECRCHTYKIAVSKYLGRCEQRSEVFVKTFFFFFFFGGGGGGGGGGGQVGGGRGGHRVDVNK